MRITSIETYIAGNPWKNWLFAKVSTDEGIYGVGEGTAQLLRQNRRDRHP